MIITTLDDSTELNLVSYEFFLKDAKKKSHLKDWGWHFKSFRPDEKRCSESMHFAPSLYIFSPYFTPHNGKNICFGEILDMLSQGKMPKVSLYEMWLFISIVSQDVALHSSGVQDDDGYELAEFLKFKNIPTSYIHWEWSADRKRYWLHSMKTRPAILSIQAPAVRDFYDQRWLLFN